ncbi:SusD/RagB family nutrient-binding outer membrane lipoprotein [Muricauda sp. 2012CJ35-5]|uniref:SusD/RagB family nutrient-binding outer membrane lipoprotein n=1 Tax=Flagellimonas spongiicola TaxID=2942208 RepID=A0ABT0PQU2_9FLAO|nr:SusD/RagB family nutrient-binding outer membrane lipoprotein [Allomuricauda spongiicola]MCL6273755.1 SusD/RagB family nutrient-binding outer membrane lipoprotein [Allomuricauda spongiicola]
MRRIIKKLFMGMMLAGFLLGCTDDFTETNTDPKVLTTDGVTPADYPLFVKRALYTPNFMPFDAARGPFQLWQSLFSDVYANYFATTAPNFDSDQFILVGGWLNGAYRYFYSRSAPQIKYVEDTAEELGFELENAMMKVWRVYAYHRVTDYWGPIPYSNFGNLENTVSYDSQEAIYNDFFTTLAEATTVLQANAGTTSFLGANDVLFGGDASKWLTFANTLRLRLAMRVKYVAPGLAQSNAEAAIAGGVMMSNDDNALIQTDLNFTNSYTTITQWGEFRMSADMESILKGYEDPRVATYYAPAASPDAADDPVGVEFPYEGMRNGQTASAKATTPFNDLASNMAGPYTAGGDPGPTVIVMAASEAYFLRAEAALEGWAAGGTSEDLYNQGITQSHLQHGYDGTNLSGNDYVTSALIPAAVDGANPAVSSVPVAYNAAGTSEEQLEQIITQKWIALWPDSAEAYAERRRTGYPTLFNRLNSLNPDIAVDEIPRRMTYTATEYADNTDAVNEAVSSLLGGPDLGTTRLWWDAKN